MLYLVCFSPSSAALLDCLDALGETQYVHEGCYLLHAASTAFGIRQQLLPFVGGTLVVTRMYRGDCAGKLYPLQKTFVARHLGPAPFSKPSVIPYR